MACVCNSNVPTIRANLREYVRYAQWWAAKFGAAALDVSLYTLNNHEPFGLFWSSCD